jgi:hypothetical protein
MIDQNLIQLIRKQFALEWDGIHGVSLFTQVALAPSSLGRR